MFFILQRFIEIINDLELSLKSIAVNRVSIPTNKSGEPQKDTLDNHLGLSVLGLYSVSNLYFPVDGDDLRILGTLESLEETDLLG